MDREIDKILLSPLGNLNGLDNQQHNTNDQQRMGHTISVNP